MQCTERLPDIAGFGSGAISGTDFPATAGQPIGYYTYVPPEDACCALQSENRD